MKKSGVTVIVTMYNVESVLARTLQSIASQIYPIREVLLIDNHSTDGSVDVAEKFIKKHKHVPMRLIRREKTYGVSDSYNLGAKLAKTEYIVTMHADSVLPTRFELARLMQPFAHDRPAYVVAIPVVVHRKKEWDQYNFWQKCLFAHVVGREGHALNGKFDAYKREVFLSLGGYDTKRFHHTMGSEDADMGFRLQKAGRIAKTDARVVHAHEKDQSYSLADWIQRRKFLAVSYGRQLQLHAHEMGLFALAPFFVKPALAMVSLLVIWHWMGIAPLALFPFVYMRSMFADPRARRDPRIMLLPFIIIYLVFAETLWMGYSFAFQRAKGI